MYNTERSTRISTEEALADKTDEHEEALEDIEDLTDSHEDELEALTTAHAEELEALRAEHADQLDVLLASKDDSEGDLLRDQLELVDANQALEDEVARLTRLVADLTDERGSLDSIYVSWTEGFVSGFEAILSEDGHFSNCMSNPVCNYRFI